MDWHALDRAAAARALGSDPGTGLSREEAARRLADHGPNELTGRASRDPLATLRRQFESTMVLILILAGAGSLFLGDVLDALAIGAIVLLNAALGFIQENKAERTLEALERLAAPQALVRRAGRIAAVAARELVAGDLILLEAGSVVGADCRLWESAGLVVQEASLTGESEPAEKSAGEALDARTPLGDRANMAYLGTLVASGRGTGIVVATGMDTEVGKIARTLAAVGREPTPLQRRLEQLSRKLAAAAAGVIMIFLAAGLARGEPVRLILMTCVSMGVAAIPEGLPAVITVVLALAAQRMHRRQALIRRLAAVEALGSVTVICSDKTGTLTENRMSVAALRPGAPMALPTMGERASPTRDGALILAAGALCSDASLQTRGEGSKGPRAIGDPTEAALVEAAAAANLPKPELERLFRRIDELPFDASRKRMTTVHKLENPAGSGGLLDILPEEWRAAGSRFAVFSKGAPEKILEICDAVLESGRGVPLTEDRRRAATASQETLAMSGMRVLAFAFRLHPGPAAPAKDRAETGLIFLGLAGLLDPPKPSARQAVRVCRQAGVRPVMITGDHPLTALAVARDLRIAENGAALAGPELQGLSSRELERRIDSVSVFARVSPRDKLRLVEAFQNRGHVVAMTGDGVNDAPALKKADIGVAMGITGTDVAKQAASMVLLDDDFATIVAAIGEGRVVYDNIRKFVRYLMATNSGELWIMLLAPLAGMPFALTPLQILWVNLVTDGLPALALGLEPAESGVMARPPRDPRAAIVDRRMAFQIGWIGLLMAAVSLGAGRVYLESGGTKWQTMLLLTLVAAQMGNAMAIRSEDRSLASIGVASNGTLLAAVVGTLAAQAAIVYVPPLQRVFHTTRLAATDFGLALLLGSTIFFAVELEKWVRRMLETGTWLSSAAP